MGVIILIMKMKYCSFGILFIVSNLFALLPAITHPIPINEIKNFEQYDPTIKQLIFTAHTLTTKNLTYQYGSANPNNSGMDCSGTIYYLLNQMHLTNVPRSSDQLYLWSLQKGKLYFVHGNNFNSVEFSHLKPGDLLFWSGTYSVNRKIPITHVMLYLGKNNQDKPIMFGASDGRTYQGKKMWGVSVFDLELPAKNARGKFIGYSCIPTLTCDK